jgi:hypothetical protein
MPGKPTLKGAPMPRKPQSNTLSITSSSALLVISSITYVSGVVPG